jgi:phosphoserine aminotransferase
MAGRVQSFAPGPSMLPDEVLSEYQASVGQFRDTGLGILELGHRSGQFEEMYESTVAHLRALLAVPDGYEVLLLHGGGRFQFTMLPANLLPEDGSADYIETGHFAAAAAADAAAYGRVNVVASTRRDRFLRLPRAEETRSTAGATYTHYTSNNTEIGTQFRKLPRHHGIGWLACDASSDLLTRRFDVGAHGCVYATSHKNLGTAGVGIVIIRSDLLAPVRKLPAYLSYATHAQASSRFNTPPISAIYVMSLMLQWTADGGGVEAMEKGCTAKSELLYGLLDDSDFYSPLVAVEDRSKVNVTFAAPTPDLEAAFQEAAAQRDLVGLWGYRKVGHLRASLFNAVPLTAVEKLADFMDEFARTNRPRLPAESTSR